MARLVLALVICAVLATARADEIYRVDPNHTFPTFEIGHLGTSTFRGRFDRTSGTISLDWTQKRGSADIVIEVSSVSTGVPKLDTHLQAADFFDTAKYPTIAFRSNDFRFDGDKVVSVAGDLTLHGVTRPVVLAVQSMACREHPRAKIPMCGADVQTTIRRSDFGMTSYAEFLADEVILRIEVEAHRQP